MQDIAISARSIISASSSSDCPCEIELLPVPSFDQLYAESGEEFVPLPPMVDTDLRNIAIILHSSGNLPNTDTFRKSSMRYTGSTSFPKPIHISHQSILQWGIQPCELDYVVPVPQFDSFAGHGERDIRGRVLSTHSIPFFRMPTLQSF